MNWFEEGKEAAHDHLRYLRSLDDEEMDAPDSAPECPWPIYAPEGAAWIRGWNAFAAAAGDCEATDEAWLENRPHNHRWLFQPEFV